MSAVVLSVTGPEPDPGTERGPAMRGIHAMAGHPFSAGAAAPLGSGAVFLSRAGGLRGPMPQPAAAGSLTPAASRSSSALSVCSQVNSASMRPKWP